jgi:hypothetical protein
MRRESGCVRPGAGLQICRLRPVGNSSGNRWYLRNLVMSYLRASNEVKESPAFGWAIEGETWHYSLLRRFLTGCIQRIAGAVF